MPPDTTDNQRGPNLLEVKKKYRGGFENHHGNYSEVSAVLLKKSPKCCFYLFFILFNLNNQHRFYLQKI